MLLAGLKVSHNVRLNDLLGVPPQRWLGLLAAVTVCQLDTEVQRSMQLAVTGLELELVDDEHCPAEMPA